MNRAIAALVLVLALFFCAIAVQPVHSAVSGIIYIKPNGTVTPSSAPIHQIGETYTLTGDIENPIIVEKDNIVLNGAGYMLQGDGSGVALNLTCSNVTVENFKIGNWQAGVLGVFNNNTVQNCQITGCQSGFKIYAQYYDIVGNTIVMSSEGIRIGPGGLNFIAGNDITNNSVGLYLFDSGNVIVQNNISNCNQTAIILDTTGWSQTVYHNNFVNNKQNLVDQTVGYPQRPLQSAVPAWDNGSSGNYWSDYSGTSTNGDGIGATPYTITNYSPNSFQAFYNYVDRYPLLMPFNIKTAIPPVPAALSPVLANSQTGALSFLKNVLQINLNNYEVTLQQDYQEPSDAGFQTENLFYQLHSSKVSATVDFQISNSSVANCEIYNGNGKLLNASLFLTNYDAALGIMQNYQAWTNDSEVGKMVALLETAGSSNNATEVLGNLDLKITNMLGHYTLFDWHYTYNGADYTGITLSLENNGYSLSFSDSRAIYGIGDTIIFIPKEQAIKTAENYVMKSISYSYVFGNGTKATITNLNINDSDSSATLATADRTSSALYPY
ncbi:MAG TPA: NosD domain-containing protein, partial [Candidatus Bathyarchaeia archaeon]|nr:NosD domain-containing protein [Candidatus Bathyarchaeia archaeon]